ncbi:hypothetical protein Mal4_04220 [Maioricimonas rarisocia]|uniref:JmjC domain-containing protein n=1 Tax=Maioricimonas rarisocia TaxID=2528026 RepID=A0A517Z146_9PLAN|nr:hypothetical protein [Maioricimonas rarisocia]QDU36139.1 hypothetical protein Mal4_04220 [Maioricimonas rarisocia]
MAETSATNSGQAQTGTLTARADTSHCYIHIVEPEEHGNELTLDLLRSASKDFSMPVVFRKLATLPENVQTREFVELEPEQKLLWRERTDDKAVAFRNEKGKTDYNYVSGREGSAREYLDEIFVHKKDVYAHLGKVSSGFSELKKHPWGTTLFEHVRDTVFSSGWFQVPEWELSGHVFLGNNTEMFAEPSQGAPGSDWHMFPTTNLFVMLAGQKKWMTRPPQEGDQLKNHEELIFPSGGREAPVEDREFDTVYLESGDVLFNVPYEWHKVVNARGPSLGAAFRVIDVPYVEQLMQYPAVQSNLKLRKMSDEYKHLATSLRMASLDPRRIRMTLNTAELMICAASRFPILE